MDEEFDIVLYNQKIWGRWWIKSPARAKDFSENDLVVVSEHNARYDGMLGYITTRLRGYVIVEFPLDVDRVHTACVRLADTEKVKTEGGEVHEEPTDSLNEWLQRNSERG